MLWWQLPARPRLAFGPGAAFLGGPADGSLVAVREGGDGEKYVRVIDLEAGRESFRLANPRGEGVMFSPDGRRLLTFREDGRWAARDAKTGEIRIDRWQVGDFRMMRDGAAPYRFAEDGRTLILLLGSHRESRPGVPLRARIEVWDLEAGRPLAAIEGVRGAAAADDGRTLVAAEEALPTLAVPIPGRGAIVPARIELEGPAKGWDQVRVIRRRDLKTGKALATIPGWIGRAGALAVASDGSEVAVGVDGAQPREGEPGRPASVRRWDLEGGRGLAPIRFDPPALAGPVLDRGDPAIEWLQYEPGGDALEIFGFALRAVPTRWDIRADPPRPDPGLRGIRSPDWRWLAFDASSRAGGLARMPGVTAKIVDFHAWDPLKPGGAVLVESSTLREHSRVGRPVDRPVGFTADSRLVLVARQLPRVAPFGAILDRIFPRRNKNSRALYEFGTYDVASGRAAGIPIRTPCKHAEIKENGALIACSQSEGCEVWDVLPHHPWGEIFGYAAIPAAAVLLAGRSARLIRKVLPKGRRAGILDSAGVSP